MTKESNKKCPGVSKQGNPCGSNWNSEDPEGLGRCKTCQTRDSKAAKSAKKKEKAEVAKVAAEPTPTVVLDYDPAQVYTCGALSKCSNQVVQGEMNTPEAAKALNLRVMFAIARDHTDERVRGYADGYKHRLLEGGPFAVCSDCQAILRRAFGNPERLFLDLSYAQRMYRQAQERKAKEAEEKAKKEAEARAEREAELLARVNEQAAERARLLDEKRARRAQQTEKALDLLDEEFSSAQTPVEAKGDHPEETDIEVRRRYGNDWLADLETGNLSESIIHHTTGPFWLNDMVEHSLVGCSNPYCPQEGGVSGTMGDIARREDGSIITMQVRGEEIPVSLMHVVRLPLKLLDRRDGGPYLSEDGEQRSGLRDVPLCNRCAMQLKGIRFHQIRQELIERDGMAKDEAKDEANRRKHFRVIGIDQDTGEPRTAPVTTTLARAVESALNRESRYRNGGNGRNNYGGGGGKKGKRGNGGQKSAVPPADPDDIRDHRRKCDSSKSLGTLGERVDLTLQS